MYELIVKAFSCKIYNLFLKDIYLNVLNLIDWVHNNVKSSLKGIYS